MPSTAATWPWGRERSTSKALIKRATAWPPRSSTRKPSMNELGHLDKLATVRLRTFLPSRQPSRSKIVGGELRLGTDIPDINQ